ncbi:MAG: family 16 glycosylhydrolase [Spirochaetaceae bacterium]|nr:family 16 glycosylhydrolase [Spirochaetaceae bacterium]
MIRKLSLTILTAIALLFSSCDLLPDDTPEPEPDITVDDPDPEPLPDPIEIIWGDFNADPPGQSTFNDASGTLLATAEVTAALNEARDTSPNSESYFYNTNSLEYVFTGNEWGGIYLQISASGEITYDMSGYAIVELALKGLEETVGNIELKFDDPDRGQSVNLLDYTPVSDGDWEIYSVPLFDFPDIDFTRFNGIGLWHPGAGTEILKNEYTATTFLLDIRFNTVEVPADLESIIAEASTLNTNTTVGTLTGNVSQAAKDAYTAAIAAAQSVWDSSPSISEINIAAANLNTATDAFIAAIISFDTVALSIEISEANTLLSNTTIGTAEGNALQADADIYELAISEAQNVMETAGSQLEVDNAVVTLAAATLTFKESIIADFSALNAAITEAETLNAITTVGTNTGQSSQTAKDNYTAAIALAQTTADNTGSTMVEIDSALTALTAATAVFNIAIVPDDPTDTYDPGIGWSPAWSDEFRDGIFDTDTWDREMPTRKNDELQIYNGDPSTAYEQDGNMIIKAEHTGTTYEYGDFTSARVISNPGGGTGDSGSAGKLFKFGKIAARIKLPSGKGVWPAFWMLGDNISETGGDTGWPACGEIDILESGSVGATDDQWGHTGVGQAIHSTAGTPSSSNYFYLDSGLFSDNYHVFEIEWNISEIIWKVDGVTVHTADINAIDEFHKEMYIIFNIAIGGSYTHDPDATTPFPLYMYIDWVRHYTN